MSTATGQHDPRAHQKARTRQAIVDAARELQGQGVTPTVAQAAEQARVSRATAYRYFPTQDALLIEASGITPVVAPVEEVVAGLAGDDVEQRLLALLDAFNPTVLAEETRMRRALFVYQDTWLRAQRDGTTNPATVRQGRRVRWLDEVLKPLNGLPDHQYRRLRAALALTLGIDSIVIMKDVCQLDDDEALDILRWTATVVLGAALHEPTDRASDTPQRPPARSVSARSQRP
jgi:AcrR family transcriptional regulator